MKDRTRRDAIEATIRQLLPMLDERELEQLDEKLARLLRARKERP